MLNRNRAPVSVELIFLNAMLYHNCGVQQISQISSCGEKTEKKKQKLKKAKIKKKQKSKKAKIKKLRLSCLVVHLSEVH